MEVPSEKKSYKEIRESAKKYYKTIKQVWSPALKDFVIFNNVGFTHLLRKHGVPRVKSEQKSRLDLLPEVVIIISDPKSLYVSFEREFPRKAHRIHRRAELAHAKVFRFTKEKDGKHISVYSGKQKTPQG
jgi:hypothetical protein